MWGGMSLWFWFAFPWLFVMLSIFSYTFCPFICLLWEMSIWVLCPFLIGLFIYLFLLLSSRSSLYILDINPLSDVWFKNIFSYSIGFLLILLIMSFPMQKFLVWCNPTCLFLDFVTCTFEVMSKTSLPRLMSRSFFPIFSYSSFRVSDIMFKYLIHFELIFVYVVW